MSFKRITDTYAYMKLGKIYYVYERRQTITGSEMQWFAMQYVAWDANYTYRKEHDVCFLTEEETLEFINTKILEDL